MKKYLIFITTILIVMLVFFLIRVLLERNKSIFENNKIVYLLNSFQSAQKNEEFMNGKYVWEISNIKRNDIINNRIPSSNYFFIISLDTIDCYSCLQFNLDLIQNFDSEKITVLIYSPMHKNFIKKYLKKGHILQTSGETKDYLLKKKLVTLLVQNNGKIIYSQVSDKNDYTKSKVFYNIAARFIN